MATAAARAAAPASAAAPCRRSASRLGVACVLVASAAYAQASLSAAAGWLSGGPRGVGGLCRGLALGPGRGVARLPPRGLRRAGGLADLLSGRDDAEGDAESPPATQDSPGVAKGRDPAEFKVGESVDGTVKKKTQMGVWMDIGATRLALLKAPTKRESFRLEPNEMLKGMTVETVTLGDIPKIDVSFAGLTQLVADRPDLPPKRGSKKVANEKEKEKTSPDESVSPIWVLDGKDVVGKEGSKVVVELRGGLSISSIDKENQTISLVKGDISGAVAGASSSSGPTEDKDQGPKKKKKEKKLPARMEQDPFADLVEGQSIKGRVRNKNSLGVWVDVGLSSDAQVVPRKPAGLLDYGEELEFVVSKLNRELGQATLTLPNLEQHVAGREDKEVIKLEDMQAPSVVTGHVASIVKRMGCFVDIGAETQVLVPRSLNNEARLELGQRVRLEVESIDTEKKRIMISAVHKDDDK